MADTYYTFIQVDHQATTEQIEVACEQALNYWRRLAIHHDPAVVQHANQALQRLEIIQSTLTDPQKRASYDLSLRADQIGGVYDPSAKNPTAPPSGTPTPVYTPPPPPTSFNAAPPIPTQPRLDAWVCGRCQTPNSVGTRFCKSCGAQLSVTCPKCGNNTEASAAFCAHCGVNIREEQTRREEEQRMQQIQQAEEKRRWQEQQAILGPIAKLSDEAWSMTRLGCIIAIFLWPISIPLWAVAIYKANKVKNTGQVLGDTRYREQANKALLWSGIPLALFTAAFVLFLCSGILSVFGN